MKQESAYIILACDKPESYNLVQNKKIKEESFRSMELHSHFLSLVPDCLLSFYFPKRSILPASIQHSENSIATKFFSFVQPLLYSSSNLVYRYRDRKWTDAQLVRQLSIPIYTSSYVLPNKKIP